MVIFLIIYRISLKFVLKMKTIYQIICTNFNKTYEILLILFINK